MSDTGFKDGAALMGALMAQSAKDLAWTRDRIEEGQREEIERLRALVVDMQEVFEGAAVIDRQTEAKWRGLEPRIWGVFDAVARSQAGE